MALVFAPVLRLQKTLPAGAPVWAAELNPIAGAGFQLRALLVRYHSRMPVSIDWKFNDLCRRI
jgi:hypothetical protein